MLRWWRTAPARVIGRSVHNRAHPLGHSVPLAIGVDDPLTLGEDGREQPEPRTAAPSGRGRSPSATR